MTGIKETPTQKLLMFFIKKKYKIHDYPKLAGEIRKRFDIQKAGKEATKELIDLVIYWETHTGIYDSLEELLNRNFSIKNK